MRKCRGAAGPMILQVNLVRAETTHRQCSSRSCRKGSFCGQACLFRESSLLWPIKAIGSASGLPTNNLEKAFGTEQQQPPYPRLCQSAAGSAWRAASVAVHQEHEPNLDMRVLPRITCCHETGAIGSCHAGDHHLLQLGRLKLDFYGERSMHKDHVVSGTPSALPQVCNRRT